MTKIKLCGLSRPRDILAANQLRPEYIGFVFAPESKRYIAPKGAAELKELLDPNIQAVGVFVNETAETVARLLNRGVICLLYTSRPLPRQEMPGQFPCCRR